MNINKKIFEVIFWIEFMGYNNPKLLSEQMNLSEDDAKKLLLRLEKNRLIKIEYRNGKIYGSQLTDKGKEIWKNKKHLKWKEELGY